MKEIERVRMKREVWAISWISVAYHKKSRLGTHQPVPWKNECLSRSWVTDSDRNFIL